MAALDRARVGLETKYVAADISKKDAVVEFENVMKACGGVTFSFIEGDDLKVVYEPAELLFIDTWHVFRQLYRELDLLHSLAKKYILLHDTTSFGCHDEDVNGRQ
jgi:hypothetical protein